MASLDSEPLSAVLVQPDGLVPKARYVDADFFALELERVWYRVWQVACREEEIANVGDFVEYTIGDQSILVVRTGAETVQAHTNACLHRGTRLATERGSFGDGPIRCRYHGWCYAVDGLLTDVVDREEFPTLPPDLALGSVRCERWGGFVFVNLDPDAEPLADFLAPLPEMLSAYQLDSMRLRSSQTTFLPANWKVVIDAFNEGYHVQGTHPQILPWTDDVNIAYEQLGTHAHYGRLPSSRRRLRPSPRLNIPDADVDEGAILAALVEGLGGAFLGDERALVEELRAADLPDGELLPAYQRRRMKLLTERGFDVSGFDPEQMTSADDVYCFPNLVGPIYPGSAILFRVRPDGLNPERSVKDTWVLEWPRPNEKPRRVEPRVYPDWTERNWGVITNQDYANMGEVQAGMHARSFRGLRLATRQESNVAHMHHVIDRYLTESRPTTTK